MGTGKVLLVFCSLVKGETESKVLAFVRCMKCVPPLDKADESLRLVCLQWTDGGSAEHGYDNEREKI